MAVHVKVETENVPIIADTQRPRASAIFPAELATTIRTYGAMFPLLQGIVVPKLNNHSEQNEVLTTKEVDISDNKNMRKRASQYAQVPAQQCNNECFEKCI